MDTKTIAIIGGGFAGARLAQSLERRLPADWSIALLSRENFITYNPLLPEVVGASLLPGHVIAPLRQMLKRTRVHMVQVTRIDAAARVVHYSGETAGALAYDQLVVACGQAANLALVEGMERHALPLKTLGDSLYLRNRAIERLEQAELETDPDMQRWLTTFVVIGGGFSGVEVAGGLADFLRASARFYRAIDPENVRIHVVHGTDRLLPELSPSLGRFTASEMRAQGIDVRLNARAVRVDEEGVTLAGGEKLAGGTVVCTIGTATNPLVADLPFPKVRGRLAVAPDMSVPAATACGHSATARPCRTRWMAASRRRPRSSRTGRRGILRRKSFGASPGCRRGPSPTAPWVSCPPSGTTRRSQSCSECGSRGSSPGCCGAASTSSRFRRSAAKCAYSRNGTGRCSSRPTSRTWGTRGAR
jgi:NADH dehydrogenase FAD-containing subunit